MSRNGFFVIDAETHLMEPHDLWSHGLPEPYRSLTEFVSPEAGNADQGGQSIRHGQDIVIPNPASRGLESHIRQQSVRRIELDPMLTKVLRDPSPANYLEGMDRAGLDVALLMPTFGMFIIKHDDIAPAHAAELCRVYNDYARDFCHTDPARLRWWAWLAPHDVNLAIEEARRCVAEGAIGLSTTPQAVNGRLYSDPAYEPLWQAVEDLNVPFGFHGGQGPAALRDDIRARFWGQPLTSVAASVMGGLFYHTSILTELILGGVLERHPGLRVMVMESAATKFLWLMWQLDEKWETFGPDQREELTLRPSEYFRRQCFVCIDPTEDVLHYAVDYLGDQSFVLSIDYPHHDCEFPDGIDRFLELPGLTETAKRHILWENVERLLGCSVAKPELEGVR